MQEATHIDDEVSRCRQSFTLHVNSALVVSYGLLIPTNAVRVTKYVGRFIEAVRGMEASLIRKSHPGGLLYVGELQGTDFSPKVSVDRQFCVLSGTSHCSSIREAARRVSLSLDK